MSEPASVTWQKKKKKISQVAAKHHSIILMSAWLQKYLSVRQRLSSVFGLQTKWTRILNTSGSRQTAICLAKRQDKYRLPLGRPSRLSSSVLVIGLDQQHNNITCNSNSSNCTTWCHRLHHHQL